MINTKAINNKQVNSAKTHSSPILMEKVVGCDQKPTGSYYVPRRIIIMYRDLRGLPRRHVHCPRALAAFFSCLGST